MSPDAPDEGAPAPALDGTTVDGGSFSLDDLRGQPVLVTFLRHAG